MRRLIAFLALAGALSMTACDNRNSSNEAETADAGIDADMVPAAADTAAPVVETGPAAGPPLDSTTLPPEKRSSEESVKPESETLFY